MNSNKNKKCLDTHNYMSLFERDYEFVSKIVSSMEFITDKFCMSIANFFGFYYPDTIRAARRCMYKSQYMLEILKNKYNWDSKNIEIFWVFYLNAISNKSTGKIWKKI